MRFNKTNKGERFDIAAKFDATETIVDGKTVRTLVGTAIVYGQLSDDRGGYFVRIRPGAAQFQTPTLALYNHDYAEPLGNTANETLSISDTPDGVRVEITLPDTQLGRDTFTLVKDRYINGMSFGIPDTTAIKKEVFMEAGKKIQEYVSMPVDEVTVTIIPAFVGTAIEAYEEAKEEAAPVEEAELQAEADLKAIELEELKVAGYRIDLYEGVE